MTADMRVLHLEDEVMEHLGRYTTKSVRKIVSTWVNILDGKLICQVANAIATA